jgi:hypothetical protein
MTYRNAHSLFAHLALVDISRRLVVVGKRDEIAGKRKQRAGMELLVDGDTRLCLVRVDNDVQVDLFERTNKFRFVEELNFKKKLIKSKVN